MRKNNLLTSGIVVGFAIFATYFGAGNLIFPPQIGLLSGNQWILGTIGMTITAILLPIIAVMGVLNAGGTPENLAEPVAPWFYKVFNLIILLFIGIGSTLPRSAATTHEMGIETLNSSIPIWATSIIFFICFYLFAKNKDNVVEKIGKVLTPILLILLLVIIGKAVITPISNPINTNIKHPLIDSMLTGYLTGDLTLGVLCSGMFITSLYSQGFNKKEVYKGMILACIVAFAGLFIIYSGLLFGGASLSEIYPADTERTTLLVGVVFSALGNPGLIALSVSVSLACLTTSVGVGATVALFLEEITNNKIKYKTWILIEAILCCILSVQGVSGLVDYVTPLFSIIYPMCIVLTFLGLFDKFVPNDGVYKGGILVSFIFGFLDAIVDITNSASVKSFIAMVPLGKLGFAWLIPTIIGMFIGYFIFKGKPRVSKISKIQEI